MIKFKINGRDIDYPTNWDDLNFEQYIFRLENSDLARVVAHFAGIDEDTFMNANIEGLELLLEATQFIYTDPTYEKYYPCIGEFKLPVTKDKKFDIRFESLGQFLDLKNEMVKHEYSFTTDREPKFYFKEPITAIKAYAKYVAIYLQKLEDGKYTPSKVPEMQERVMKFKAAEVITAGQFFFLKLMSLLSGTHATFLNTILTPMKSKPALTTLRKSSVITASSPKSRVG